MVINLFIGLILISAASMFITQGKRRKIWSILLLAALCGVSWMVVHDLHIVSDSGFMYQWLPYPKLQADFNISASLHMQQMLTPMLYLLAILIFFNIIDNKESYSLNISVLNLLSFIMIILLASGHDLFQLMFASALLSIICFYIPDDAQSRHKLFIYNFLAEMACFTALSIVYSAVGSISLSTISNYSAKIPHKDFVAFLLLFSFGCKAGLAFFNGHYNALFSQPFNRLCSVFVLSLPFSSLVLLAKLSPLVSGSLFADMVKYWCLLSFMIAGIHTLVADSYRSKIIAVAQMFYALAFYNIYIDASQLYIITPKLLSVMLMCMSIIYYITTPYFQKTIFLKLFQLIGSFIIFNAILIFITGLLPSQQIWLAFFYAAILGMLTRMLMIDEISVNSYFNENRNILGAISTVILSAAIILYTSESRDWLQMIKLCGVFVLFSAVPSNFFAKIIKLNLWNYNIIESVYEKLFVTPLKFFGRILWLAFDFMLIERGVIGSAVSFGEFTSTKLRNLQTDFPFSWMFWLIFGVGCLIVFAGVYTYD